MARFSTCLDGATMSALPPTKIGSPLTPGCVSPPPDPAPPPVKPGQPGSHDGQLGAPPPPPPPPPPGVAPLVQGYGSLTPQWLPPPGTDSPVGSESLTGLPAA